ncbi:hypothetical protein OGX97_10420 [Citrobacter sp. Cpo061]|uniref:hypothetical protein n=1 Tax=Citrobacter TaxID=544 RepID=UPI002449737C|nr:MULTISPECIES: hypothetical protein [Citrobacter]MDH1798994.1 hypothetical protein [Citrobacter portucalensis]MDM2867628.1 hypothetical protein [Citrobacter sp. Cpo061]
MQTINNRMTETQIADLFSLAVQLQVKAEESDDRDTAILAYSIQNACSNLTESQREFRAADATIHNLELKITEMAVQLANADSKCRELAGVVAENADLKSLIEQHAGSIAVCPNCSHEEPSETDDIVALYRSMETPATDAFLAEVRAQGVERMIEVKQQQLDGMHPDTFAIGAVRDSIRRDIYELKVFAEILRQEAAQ